MTDFPRRETGHTTTPSSTYELPPPSRSVHEVGRVTGLPRRPFPGSSGRPSVLRVAVVNDAVSLCIGGESVHLDAAGRDHFAALWQAAEREARAHEGVADD